MYIGILLSLFSILILQFLTYDKRNEILSSLLVGIAAIYVGFALNDGRNQEVSIEIVVALIFFGISLFGRWRSIYILGIGYILHGLWDVLHDSLINTDVVSWYPSFCSVYDFIVGIYILSYSFHRSRYVCKDE